MKAEGQRPFVVLGCGMEKLDRAAAAVDLYTGPLYRSRLAYARALGGPDLIVSAKYGVLAPTEVVEPYDLRLEQLGSAELEEWVARVASEVTARAGDRDVVLLASGMYADWVDRVPMAVSIPAARLPIGKQRQELARLTRELSDAQSLAPELSPDEELVWLRRELPAMDDDVSVELSAAAIRLLLKRPLERGDQHGR